MTTLHAIKPHLVRGPDGCLRRVAPKAVSKPIERPQTPPQTLPIQAPPRTQKPTSKPLLPRPLLDHLRAMFPAIAQDIPLALGSLADMVNGGINESTARTFMRLWTQRPEYLQAIVTGTHRYHLDGSQAGAISDRHREHANQSLKATTP